ncbi:MAG TPA: GNAT family protein [Thermoanaerobaculia bacterium]|nr:GNAT family protein [Thermoanaerobaculia bacterium]
MTEEVRLRRYAAADARSVHEAARESTAEIFPWMQWCHPDFSLADAEAWVNQRESLFREGREYSFAIIGTDDRYLGTCDINQINDAARFGNVGYWIRTSASGRGVVPRAIRQLARFAFESTDLIRLEIVCAAGNVRSQRAAEKAGAAREGVLKDRLFLHGRPHDAVMYAIVRSAWRAESADERGSR